MTFKQMIEKDYTLHSSTNNKDIVTYVHKKHVFFLIIYEKQEQAILEGHFGLITFRLGPFSVPNKNFKIFERQMIHVISKLEETT